MRGQDSKKRPFPPEEAVYGEARKAIDEWLKNKEFPVPKAVLLLVKPFFPALEEVWVNGYLAGFADAADKDLAKMLDDEIEAFYNRGKRRKKR